MNKQINPAPILTRLFGSNAQNLSLLVIMLLMIAGFTPVAAWDGSKPVFSAASYQFNPKETLVPGAGVGQVKANDPEGSTLKYSITTGNTNSMFSVDQATGLVKVSKSLNYNLQKKFLITVRATDAENLFAEVSVVLLVAKVDSVPDFKTISWSTGASQPLQTHEIHGEVVHGKLYIFGGYNPARRPAYIPTKKAFVYDPVVNKWTAIADLPHVPNGTDFGGVTHEGLTTDGTDIYIAGGYISNSTGTGQVFGTKQVYKYNVASDTYTAMPSLPESLASGQMMYLQGKLHFMGGANMSRNDVAVHYVLDLDNLPAGWKALAPLTNPRNHAGSTVFDGKIYFIGGSHGHDAGAVAQSTVEYYDEIANAWNVVADLPVPRDHISSSVIVAGDRILVLGGKRTHTSVLDLVSAYDPVLDKWEDITPLNNPISSGVAAFLNNKVIYTGGAFTSTNRQGSLPNVTTSQKVEDLLLINADNGTVIRSIADNDVINLAALNVKNVNIEAVTSPGKVGSVVFNLSGTESKDVTESLAPYALFGDNKAGTYNPWAPGIGDYILSATPFSSSGGTGSKGISLTKSFSITNDQVSTFNLKAVGDAYVRDGNYADRNYGTETELVVKGSPNQNFSRYAYLKFELGSITAVSSAKLRIYGSNASTSTSITVKAFGSSNSWNEQTITFNSQPSSSANALSQVQVTGQPDYFDLDVTDFVRSQLNGSKIVSIVLKNIDNQDNILSFHSRENTTNQPLLTVLGTSSGSTNSIALDPLADASVRDGAYSGKNYGDDTSFLVKSSPNSGFSREAYLKFSLSSVPKVGKAKLRLYGRNASGNTSVTVGCYALNDDGWTEAGITWSTAPVSLTTVLGSVLITNSQQYYEIDVTSFVRSQLSGDKVVSFVLKDVGTSDKILEFHSRENPQDRPQLLILTDSVGGSTGPTTVNTEADASVRDGSYATTNYGSDGSLLVKGSPKAGFSRDTYLRFPLSSVSTTIGTAKVRVYGRNTSGGSGVKMDAYALDNDTWPEGTITWNTAPAAQTISLGSVTVTDQAQYYDIDVTSYVKSQASGDKIVGLVLKDTGNADKILEFNSKENGQYPPQLVITDDALAPLTTQSPFDITEETKRKSLNIFPNPFRNTLNVNFTTGLHSPFSVKLSSAGGEVLYLKTFSQNLERATFSLAMGELNLKPGSYFLSIFSEYFLETYQVIKGN